jgi:hypothetical protein
LIGLIILCIFILIRRRQRDDPQHPRQSIFGSKGASSPTVSHPDIDGQDLCRNLSTTQFASGTIVPFASRESRGSMSPMPLVPESSETPYGFGMVGDDVVARPGLRPSMDSSYRSDPYNESSPDLFNTGDPHDQAAAAHSGEMREKKGASRALFTYNTGTTSEDAQISSGTRSPALQSRPRTTSPRPTFREESSGPQESDIEGSTFVIRHVDSANRSGEPSVSRVVELPPEYADRSSFPGRS